MNVEIEGLSADYRGRAIKLAKHYPHVYAANRAIYSAGIEAEETRLGVQAKAPAAPATPAKPPAPKAKAKAKKKKKKLGIFRAKAKPETLEHLAEED